MNVTFLHTDDRANSLNGVDISDSEQLFEILEGLRNRDPFVCKLTGENGFEIDIGIGKDGCVQYSRTDGEPPYLLAVAPGEERQGEEIEFMMGGTPTPIANRYCMPFHYVREIAGYFLTTGHTHPAFSWEGV
jgi:Immunity protein Imm1